MKSFTSKERKELLKRWNESRRRASSSVVSSSTLLRDGNGKEEDINRVPREKRNAATGPSMKRREGNGVVGETSAAVESSFEKTKDFTRRRVPSNAARLMNDKNSASDRFNEECEEHVDEKRSGGRQKRKMGWMCDGDGGDAARKGERGTKELSSSEEKKKEHREEEEELWRKQSRSVWLMRTSVSSSSCLRDAKSASVDESTADAATFDDDVEDKKCDRPPPR